MKRIEDIISLKDVCAARGSGCSADVSGIAVDSREVRPGDLFFAMPGVRGHGKVYIADALARGARCVVVQEEGSEDFSTLDREAVILRVKDIHRVLLASLSRFYDDAPAKMNITGITGTNGKTTVTYLLEAVSQRAGERCGVMGTISHRVVGHAFPSRNTTPGLVDIHRLCRQMNGAGAVNCFMEVSSHALDQKRVVGICFQSAVFTNLTQDHLDYHADLEAYFQAKALLFRGLDAKSAAVINIDDPFGRRLLTMTEARVWTYGLDRPADFTAENIVCDIKGMTFTVRCPSRQSLNVRSALIGRHNIYNILAAVGVAWERKWPLEKIEEGLWDLKGVPGRLERIDRGQDFDVFVDYAHTEDGLRHVLRALREVSRGKLTVIFGCGGDRDQSKRPKMGQVAASLADEIILTNDNPRGEDPDQIIRQIRAGITHDRYTAIPDRQQAIREGMEQMRPGDVLLIAGKGHEDYQIFRDRIVPFDDRKMAQSFLKVA
jgi:UDP-N-acetylmuramoyl-L-alanyl-D-glutamate--2,6-diaminopimelate ligase